MLKLLFGVMVGAVLMYLFDPRQGEERRRSLSERFQRSDGSDMMSTGREKFGEAREQASATMREASSRAESTISHARERFGETVDEARGQAEEFGEHTQERVRSTIGGDQQGEDRTQI